MNAARTAALATGLVAHTGACTRSGSKVCLCAYEARLEALAEAFEGFRARELYGPYSVSPLPQEDAIQ